MSSLGGSDDSQNPPKPTKERDSSASLPPRHQHPVPTTTSPSLTAPLPPISTRPPPPQPEFQPLQPLSTFFPAHYPTQPQIPLAPVSAPLTLSHISVPQQQQQQPQPISEFVPPTPAQPSSRPSMVSRVLQDNRAMIPVIIQAHNEGRYDQAMQMLQRLQRNLAYVASIADQESGFPIRTVTTTTQPTSFPPPGYQMPLPPIRPQPQPPPQPGPGVRTPSGARRPVRHWTPDEVSKFEKALDLYGKGGRDGRPDLNAIASYIGTRTPPQVRSYLQKYLERQERGRGTAVPARQEEIQPAEPPAPTYQSRTVLPPISAFRPRTSAAQEQVQRYPIQRLPPPPLPEIRPREEEPDSEIQPRNGPGQEQTRKARRRR